MTESTAHCLFCGQLHDLTKGKGKVLPNGEISSGHFIGIWITKLEFEDCFGLKQTMECGRGAMFLCANCRKNMNRSIENNAEGLRGE